MTLHGSRTTDGRGRVYDSVVDTIGITPCIRVNRIAPKLVRLYVKAEFFLRDDLQKLRRVVSQTLATHDACRG